MTKRVLFTTSYKIKDPRLYGDVYDYPRVYQRRILYMSGRRDASTGLRFITYNIPDVKILEFPTWSEYVNTLRQGWDIVGFSFYTWETPEILQMIKEARRQDVKEIWGGNYGVLTDGIEKRFDRIFIGYAEREIANALGKKLDVVRHPPIFSFTGFLKFRIIPTGLLFVTRGCGIGCRFCHTTIFAPKPEKVPLESIEKVVRYYKSAGIDKILILDEFFGMIPSHAKAVAEVLCKYGMHWRAMTRPGFLFQHLDEWEEMGFNGCLIGIESLSQEVLDEYSKSYNLRENLELIRRLQEKNIAITGYYIIGAEKDTRDTIKRDIKKLASLKLDTTQINILTPLPKTSLWDEIENKYGIFEKNWSKFDQHHLVWNHPNIKPDEMENLLDWGLKICHPNTGVLRTWLKSLKTYNSERRFLGGLRYYMKSILRSYQMDYTTRFFGQQRTRWPELEIYTPDWMVRTGAEHKHSTEKPK
jgi:radical SAM superfamily enzyme YgiQ (UPF0313 family)